MLYYLSVGVAYFVGPKVEPEPEAAAEGGDDRNG